MGKATEPPKCKACGKAHWGTCVDPETRGYLSSRAAPASPKVRKQRIAKAVEVLASMPPAKSPSKRGRPKTVADRKAYKAEKERQRRAAKKDKP